MSKARRYGRGRDRNADLTGPWDSHRRIFRRVVRRGCGRDCRAGSRRAVYRSDLSGNLKEETSHEKKWAEEITDDNEIWLVKSNSFSCSEGFPTYRVQKSDPDDTDVDDFNEMVYEIMASLANHHVVLYDAPYKRLKPAKLTVFCGLKPAQYKTDGATTRLKQSLIDQGWSDGIFADIEYLTGLEDELWGAALIIFKRLFILQENLDVGLLKKTDMSYEDEDYYGLTLCIYHDSAINRFSNDVTTIKAYRQSRDFIAFIYMHVLFAKADIVINDKYLSEQVLTDTIRPIVEQHGKTFILAL